MTIVRRAVRPLQGVLALTFGLLVVLQTLSFPGQFSHMAREDPDLAYLRWPLTAFTVVEILCAQVVIVCTWRLLGLVRQDRIFSLESFRWVDRIIGSIVTAWLLLVGVTVWVGVRADDPGLPLLLVFLVTAGAGFGLLLLVMRALLEQATDLRTEMDAVI